jgi:hypothetical protein
VCQQNDHVANPHRYMVSERWTAVVVDTADFLIAIAIDGGNDGAVARAYDACIEDAVCVEAAWNDTRRTRSKTIQTNEIAAITLRRGAVMMVEKNRRSALEARDASGFERPSEIDRRLPIVASREPQRCE